MQLKTIPYLTYEGSLPQKGNFIVGQEIGQSIYVYQAFNPSIANYAVANQKFGGNAYSFNRMTWIKPNFLWMMYRAGWATKVNQERILAIKIKKSGFLELLDKGVYSSFQAAVYGTHNVWKTALATSEVRIQWDPDHDPLGEKLERRAVQIGFKGATLHQFNDNFLEEITDITDFVTAQKVFLDTDRTQLLVMQEAVVTIPADLKKKYNILA